MRATVETITPAKAAEYLGRNTRNRPIDQKWVVRHAAAILRGEFSVTNDAISFNGDGTLLNGQHRLAAIIEAGQPVQQLVVHGLPQGAQDVMDQGRKRSLAQALRMDGEENSTLLAAMIANLYRHEMGNPRSNEGPSIRHAKALLRAHPRLRDSASVARRVNRELGIPGAIAGFLHYHLSNIDRNDAEFFFETLISGEGLVAGDPIFELRRVALRNLQRVPSRRMTRAEMWALIIKAWNAYRNGQTVRLLRFTVGGAHPEAFPEAF